MRDQKLQFGFLGIFQRRIGEYFLGKSMAQLQMQ